MELEFYIDEAGHHRWRITGKNGKIVHAATEGFKTKRGAVKNLFLLTVALSDFANRHVDRKAYVSAAQNSFVKTLSAKGRSNKFSI